ncbi:MAG: hypothetical protein Fur0015_04770 [Ignavibacteriales bacterium]
MTELKFKTKKNYRFNNWYRIKILYVKNYINLFLFYLLKVILKSKRINDSRNILIVNSEQLGDIILSFDFLYSLIISSKYGEIFLVIDEQYVDLIRTVKLPISVIGFSKNKYRHNIFYRYKFLARLNDMNLFLSINLSPERGSVNDELTILCGSNNTICFSDKSLYYDNKIILRYNKFYTTILNHYEMNKYNIYQKLLEHLSIETFNYKINIENDRLNNQYILIAPSTLKFNKDWPRDYFFQLIKELSVEHKIKLLGTENQAESLQKMRGLAKNVETEINLSFDEIIKLMGNAKLFVGLDSGMTHLALQMNKPLVAIIGGGSNGTFFPYKENSNAIFLYFKMDCFGCNWNCIYKEKYCLTNVNVSTVIKSIKKLLNN